MVLWNHRLTVYLSVHPSVYPSVCVCLTGCPTLIWCCAPTLPKKVVDGLCSKIPFFHPSIHPTNSFFLPCLMDDMMFLLFPAWMVGD